MCKTGKGENPLGPEVCVQLDEQPAEATEELTVSFHSHFPLVHPTHKQPEGSWQESFGNVVLGYQPF